MAYFPQSLISTFLAAFLLLTSGVSRALSIHDGGWESGRECQIDPNDPNARFRLLDPKDGIPFVDVDGAMRKSPNVLESIPEYHFTRSAVAIDAFDLRQESSYVALFDSGRIGFVNVSSNGLEPMRRNGGTYLTTIFTISCDGTISMQPQDDVKYEFSYHPQTQGILARPDQPKDAVRTSKSVPDFHSRISDGFNRTGNSWEPFTFLAGPRPNKAVDGLRSSNSARHLHSRAEGGLNHVGDSWEAYTFFAGPMRVSDHSQIGFSPRCPANPYGLQASVKPNARPASFNGCGANNGMKFPDFRFETCCNSHDLCYDDCGMNWEDCNENFSKCMYSACHEYYKAEPTDASAPASNTTTWTEWGCNGLAETYAEAVGTRIGAWSFSIANEERCACGCPSGTSNCTDLCLGDCNDRCTVLNCAPDGSAATPSLGTSSTLTGNAPTAKPTESTGSSWWPFR